MKLTDGEMSALIEACNDVHYYYSLLNCCKTIEGKRRVEKKYGNWKKSMDSLCEKLDILIPFKDL